MQLQHSSCYYRLKTIEIQLMLFHQRIHRTKYKQFRKHCQWMLVSRSVATDVSAWVVIKNHPFMGCHWNYLRWLWFSIFLPRKLPTEPYGISVNTFFDFDFDFIFISPKRCLLLYSFLSRSAYNWNPFLSILRSRFSEWLFLGIYGLSCFELITILFLWWKYQIF